ncbi:MAG: hypothetical protein WC761_00715 [Candidatus Paceibacterota bacterium]|jgi:hypothetical protein
MAIQRITPDDQETFTLETNPLRTFSSSSVGITGAVNIFARRSDIEKEIYPLSMFSASLFNDQNLDEFRRDILRATGSTNIQTNLTSYLSAVNEQQASVRKQQTVQIIRFTPPFSFNSDTLRKSVVTNTLMPYYRTDYPRSQFTYANYHCLNFYTASNVSTASVLLYPNPQRASGTLTDYGFSGSFSFDFWIKPKYTTDLTGSSAVYRPGSIMHLTGGYALSLHSGSSRDVDGRVDAFRLLLQLSSAAETVPDQAVTGTFAYFSNDNCLPINEWSHVTVRWGGSGYNFGTGSFLVNNSPEGYFTLTGNLNVGDQNIGDPSVLCIGNYYEGQNTVASALTKFFTNDTTEREGLYSLSGDADFSPVGFAFNYPLNAEIHELKLYEKYLSTTEVAALQTKGPVELGNGLLFYVPPFFTQESPFRKFYGTSGGVPVTPFFTKDVATTTPFATDMAFGCGGHFINLENYVRDFATGRYARLWNLTASIIDVASSTALSANTILYSTGSNIKRLYSILPCDNGNMVPNYELLTTLSRSTFINDLGNYEPGVISLRNMITGTYSSDTMIQPTGSIITALVGGNSPDNVGDIPGDSLAIYHRTRDASSNQIVFFDVSNLYYGNQIKPGSFILTDSNLSASSGKVSITIKDDGRGNLYRADADGDHATWASVGNIFYNEGIAMLKFPQLYFFGGNEFSVEFKGVQNIHVLTINAFARPLQLISSSNPSYSTGSVDGDIANITDSKYVYITHVNLHDDNMNVISRTAVAQHLLKRSGDKFLFKIRMDY